ncbi:MAG: adenylosuccinate synthase [Acidobacteriota bacterium]|nr:adenylosuccinate synthase [Acidobacteriota bacterium]
MGNLVVLGMQWGDEGKGKIVDLLCPAFDVVCRYQGGNNAGHTVKFEDRHFALHLIPSGILRPGILCVLGNGLVLDPEAFFEELKRLSAAGIDVADRLFVSDRIQLILPLHVDRDRKREEGRGNNKIGTTGRGIGPAYEAKAARAGLRAGELVVHVPGEPWRRSERLMSRLTRLSRSGDPEPLEEMSHQMLDWAEKLAPLVRDTGLLLNTWMDEGKTVLFEGAQGTLLDVDHGTYPYVTSSNASAGGAATGTGVPPSRLGSVLGVLKAYATRVGEGPFVGELHDESGDYLRERGHEYGTTTGRPRRCGWLDTVAAGYARRINGVDSIALTKLDILDKFDEIPVCTGYRIGGEVRREFPSTVEDLERAEPVYEVLPGWRRETVGILAFDDLPPEARNYVAFVEEAVGAPVSVVSTGPRREETLLRRQAGLTSALGDRIDRLEGPV